MKEGTTNPLAEREQRRSPPLQDWDPGLIGEDGREVAVPEELARNQSSRVTRKAVHWSRHSTTDHLRGSPEG